jgi:septal ring factor EnvC (AmiA/AmiB activator)
LSTEDIGRLCATEQLNWSVLNESVVQSLFAMRKEVEQQRKEIQDLRDDIWREQSVNVAMKAAIDEHRRTIEELESANQRQEEIFARQVSEIEDMKATKNKCEEELKCNTEAGEAHEPK